VGRRLGALLIALALGSPAALAQPSDPSVVPQDPRWGVALGGGYFVPAVDGFSDQYGSRGGWMPVLALSYALIPSVWLQGDVGYWTSKGFVRGALTGRVSADQQHLSLIPVTVGAEYQVRFSRDQFVVPFIAAGYRRVAYRLAVDGDEEIRGGANGWVARSGIDFSLNPLDPSSASSLYADYAIARTSLRVEAQWAKVNAPGTVGDIDLGGTTVLAGLRFEF
jgi:hypothetical protein